MFSQNPPAPLKIPTAHESSVTSFARSSWASFFSNWRHQADALIDFASMSELAILHHFLTAGVAA
jgi:hypothetical protein